jgi:uncharacterized protein (DUF2384 family)
VTHDHPRRTLNYNERTALKSLRTAAKAKALQMEAFARGHIPGGPEAELRLGRVAHQALALFGDNAINWLFRANPVLRAVPIDLVLNDEEGAEAVLAVLGQLEHGSSP